LATFKKNIRNNCSRIRGGRGSWELFNGTISDAMRNKAGASTGKVAGGPKNITNGRVVEEKIINIPLWERPLLNQNNAPDEW